MKKGYWPFVMTALVLILLYLPLIILTFNSFNASKFAGSWGGFSLKWYQQLFVQHEMWTALGNSLLIAVSATVASTVLGFLAAFALYRNKSTLLQKVHWGFVYVPLVVPDILMGISLLLFFVFLNINLGLFTIFLAHTTFCLSYVAMIMYSKLETFDEDLIEAAQDLGATSQVVFRRIMLPLMMPGVMASALLAFTLSIDDFVITFFVAGQGATTLPIYIYGMIKFGSTPIINALSAILLVLTLFTVLVVNYTTKEKTT